MVTKTEPEPEPEREGWLVWRAEARATGAFGVAERVRAAPVDLEAGLRGVGLRAAIPQN
jgi:hypothetical protein